MRARKIETVMTYEEWKKLFVSRLKERFMYWLTLFLETAGITFAMFLIWLLKGY